VPAAPYGYNETKFEFFPIRASNSADKFFYFQKPVICTNLITCSAKLSAHAAERGQ